MRETKRIGAGRNLAQMFAQRPTNLGSASGTASRPSGGPSSVFRGGGDGRAGTDPSGVCVGYGPNSRYNAALRYVKSWAKALNRCAIAR
jgi:hypothetical protein